MILVIRKMYCQSCRSLSGNKRLPWEYHKFTFAYTSIRFSKIDFDFIINRTFANSQQIVANKNDNGNDDISLVDKMKREITQNAKANATYQLYLASRENPTKKIRDTSKKLKNIYSFSSLSNLVKKFVDELEELSHMDEVRRAQERVMIVKDKLKDASECKRGILRQLSFIREEIQRNHSETCSTQRGTKKYVELTQKEYELIIEEKEYMKSFAEADDREHSLFNELSASITDSYEKEKIHANSLKLWGFLGTLIASFVTFIASLIGYLYHTSKYGAMTNDFQRSVDKTISKETNLLRKEVNSMKDDLIKMISSNSKSIFSPAKVAPKESWGSYLNRHTRWTYSWMWPTKK